MWASISSKKAKPSYASSPMDPPTLQKALGLLECGSSWPGGNSLGTKKWVNFTRGFFRDFCSSLWWNRNKMVVFHQKNPITIGRTQYPLDVWFFFFLRNLTPSRAEYRDMIYKDGGFVNPVHNHPLHGMHSPLLGSCIEGLNQRVLPYAQWHSLKKCCIGSGLVMRSSRM